MPPEDLFRQEAVEASRRRLKGTILVATPLSVKALAALSLMVVVALVGFALLATYSRSVSGQGWITSGGGIVSVRSPAAGQIAFVNARDGTIVQRGTELATLTITEVRSDADSSTALLIDRLRVAEGRARAEADRYQRERDALGAELVGVRSSIVHLRRRIDLHAERIATAEADLARVEPIAAEGFLPARELAARKATILDLQSTMLLLQGELAGAQAREQELMARLDALDAAGNVGSFDGQLARNELEGSLAEQRESAERAIVAARPGQVVAMYVSVGQSVAAGDRIAAISQTGGAVRAEIFLSREAVQHVRIGQSARVWTDVDGRRRGRPVQGTVGFVSRLPLTPNEIDAPGFQGEAELYKVQIEFESQPQGRARLVPGQMMFADIRIRRRPFWALFSSWGT